MTDQLQLFASDGADLTVDDLGGLLLGPGHIVQRDGRARISVLVDDVWRAEALVGEFAARGLAGEFKLSRDDTAKLVVRTPFHDDLLRVAMLWAPGLGRGNPIRVRGASLRLWAIAAGHAVEQAYQLGLSPTDDSRWERSGAALASIGLTGVLVGPRAGGPAYRITSLRRLGRLRMLVGERPEGAPEHAWP